MKVSFNWLKEFTPIIASLRPEDVADRLTMRGLEVEGLERTLPAFSGVVVGEILEIEKPASAEKLSLCRVDVGTDILSVICGAPNVAVGKKVPLAMLGGRIGEVLIQKKRIRGIDSLGMICSERELGLSDNHAGILILPDDTKIGVPLEEALEIADSVLEVNVTPNRGDCQSILGIAREIASIYGDKIVLPPIEIDEDDDGETQIQLSVHDVEACPRYVLRMIKDVSIGPAPLQIRNRLTKCGMRPINSIVDITNYIMLELGQPLHAFDYSRIVGKRIDVRLTHKSIIFRTLDGTDRALENGDLLICDGSGPVALAGIMGGENSEIVATTRIVALESAFFNPLFIRRTARRLDLRSEASVRFERGIDIGNVDYAANRAISLMHQAAGGTVLRGFKEVFEKPTPKHIVLSSVRCNQIIGTAIKKEEMVHSLESIGIRPVGKANDSVTFSIPSHRNDLNEYIDLIEEVARIYGYDKIPATLPVSPLFPVTRNKIDTDIDYAKRYLTSCGFFEVINYGFFNAADIDNFSIQPPDTRASYVPILNPISKELGVMRTFLAPGILENLAYNLNRGTKNLQLFEVGKTFCSTFGEKDLPQESVHLCCVITGKEREYFWRDPFKDFDFFDLKGVLEGLCERFNLSLVCRRTSEPFLDGVKAADIFLGETKLGWLGEMADVVLTAYDIKEKVLCADLNLDMLSTMGNDARSYSTIPRYPAVVRDFSFYVDDLIPVATLIERIRKVSPLIVSVGVFDLFKKEVRSISFRVVFQSFEETLTDDRITSLQQVIIDGLTGMEGIKLRT